MLGLAKRTAKGALAWAFPKSQVRRTLEGRRVYVRLATPDAQVARTCFRGEFDAAINAARPLQYGFIVDAGGYIGTAAIVLAEAFPDARIVTIEPSRDNFAVLRRNVEPYPRIVALNQALGPVEGTVTLRNRGTGEWGFTVVPEPSDCASPEVVHDVSVITVPAILEKFGVRGIDLLKLDIEGAECALLRDAPPWVGQTRVIFAELHDRIMPGCTSTFDAAMAGRRQLSSDGEKVLSVLS